MKVQPLLKKFEVEKANYWLRIISCKALVGVVATFITPPIA
jgi:hypothetical protein